MSDERPATEIGEMTDQAPAAPRRGNVGVETFEQVQALVRAEGLSQTKAFQRLSEQTGRSAGTVAANYYRIARQRGLSKPRGKRATTKPAGQPRGAATVADAALSKAMATLQELAVIVRSQEAELTQLRDKVGQLDELKSLLSRL